MRIEMMLFSLARHARAGLAATLMALASHGLLAAQCAVSATSLEFGAYDVFSARGESSTATIEVKCTRGGGIGTGVETVAYAIKLTAGDGGYASRILSSGAHRLNYNIYTAPTYSSANIWGDGSGATQYVSGRLSLLDSTPQSARHTAYGFIPPRQDAAAGAYQAALTVVVEF